MKPNTDHASAMELAINRIREATTPLGKFIEACRGPSPICLVHLLTDYYRTHVNLRRREEWKCFWYDILFTTYHEKRRRVVRLLKKLAATKEDLHELVRHPWWRRLLLTHRLFIRVVAHSPREQTELIRWLVKMNYFLEAWYQTFMLLPPTVSVNFGEPRLTTIPLDCSLVTPELFKQVADILYSVLERASTPEDLTAVVEKRDYFNRGWRNVEHILRARNIPILEKKGLSQTDIARKYCIIPRTAKKILELDRALQDIGWRTYVQDRPLRWNLPSHVLPKITFPATKNRSAA